MLNTDAYTLEKICFAYRNRQIIDNLSLTVPEGSICAVLGPNGSGKTTLLHILLGWLKPDSGKISVRGKILKDLSPRERGRLISLLPQMENLGFDYTVMEYILLGRSPYLHPLQQPSGKDIDIARSSLSQVEGLPLEYRKIPSLSGGETQTALMARSLTQEPGILLLDEPTNHLDPARRRKMLDIIGVAGKQNRTVIFTTHEPAAAAGTADYLILMYRGKPVMYGPFDKLFTEKNLTQLYGITIKIHRLENGAVTVSY